MVDIHLSYCETPFLSIPNGDVERLSNRPFRWLRYIMFSICGARGDLFETLDTTDDPVDYNTSLADLPAVIYYRPSGDCIFVDYEGLSDRLTSTNRITGREIIFREAVLQRDGTCVITNEDADDCDAAHLIPRSKGDEYIDKVVRLRSHLYSSPPSISGIDDGQNGMLLRKDLHSRLGCGRVAFLETPNYELDPTDIRRVNLGPVRTEQHITLQQLEKPKGADPDKLAESIERAGLRPSTADLNAALGYGAHLDVQFCGPPPPPLPPPPPPSTLILDYVYGVAAYNRWRSTQDEGYAIMKDYRNANYACIPPLPRQNVDHNHPFERPDDPPDDPNNPDWLLHTSRRRGDVMATAMDELNLALMSLQGITPQEAAIRREKRMEEELKAQETSRSKVMEWMKTTAVGGS